jgi:hypothetical protein
MDLVYKMSRVNHNSLLQARFAGNSAFKLNRTTIDYYSTEGPERMSCEIQ